MGKGFATIGLLMALTACSGGGGGGDRITLASGDQAEDPVVLEVPIAYVRRPVPEDSIDLRDPLAFNPGATLLVRERSAATAEEIDLTPQLRAVVAEELQVEADTLAVDVKDLESSYDGNTLLFAARIVPEPVAANLEQTTWNLWTYDFESGEANYLIPSRIKRNEGLETGGAQDIAPHYLPDDRIVFSSTRQVISQGRQLNEGRSQLFSALDEDRRSPAAVLHIYDPQQRQAEFTQISFNLSHDLDPVVQADGHILFSRWNNTVGDHISLYRITPAGAALSPVYGFHSENSGTDGAAIAFSKPRELANGQLLALAQPTVNTTLGGELIVIDAANYAEYERGTWNNVTATGPGHTGLVDADIRSDQLLARGGRYGAAYPLRDGTDRLLLTWSECRVIDADANPAQTPEAGDYLPCTLQADNDNPAPPLYGAWIYDPAQNTQKPVVLAQEGQWVSEIIAAENRDFPDLLGQADNYDAALAVAGEGRLLIDSVYDEDGDDASPAGIANHARPGSDRYRQRPARFLRLIQPVPLPDDDIVDIPGFAYGVTRAFGFREIAGYVPVEPDGSVGVRIAASRPFSFEILNAAGKRIGARHNYWLQVAPGETLHCSGCHNHSSGLPHGRLDSQPVSANPGAISLASGATGFPGTNASDLFAAGPGQTMAQTWNFQRPEGNEVEAQRPLDIHPTYTDQWSASDLTPDTAIDDRAYDPAWTDIPAEQPLVVPSLDPGEPSRIVINYLDHIQPIWTRVRTAVLDAEENPVDNCLGCHSDADGTAVSAGQLDLSDASSDIDPDHVRSYRELLSADSEQWLDNNDAVSDRLRRCTETDADGNTVELTVTLPIGASARAGSALASTRFFSCFEGGNCGRNPSAALPDNCTEDEGTPVPATRNTVDHTGMLSAAELRLIAEWLDLGGQYYNNPFDARLVE